MYLYEAILQKRIIDKKIEEIRKALVSSPDNGLSDTLISLLDAKRSLLIKINIANNSSTVIVGSQKMLVTNAVIIRDAINEKIALLTSLIGSDSGLDKLHLMQQRDSHYNDYLLMDIIIKNNDLSVIID
jgi:hypothetical protein